MNKILLFSIFAISLSQINMGFTQESWTATNLLNAPSPRDWQTAVWTSTKMIVWGGFGNGYFNTGGIFDPVTNTWVATTINNAPHERAEHSAIWTGTKMIIWGGRKLPEYRKQL